MVRAVTILLVGVSISACGRYGFKIIDGEAAFSGADDVPFGGAIPDGVEMGVIGATLAVARPDGDATFVVMPDQLPSPIMSAGACGCDEHVYITGGSPGYTGSGCSDQILKYDPINGVLSPAQTLPSQYRGANLVLHPDGNLYSVMGYCSNSAEERKVYGFQPDIIGVTEVGRYDDGAYHATTGILPDAAGNRLLVAVGGYGSGPLRDVVQTMDPRDGTAQILGARLPTHRCMATSVVVDDIMYVFGGSAPANTNNCEPPGSTATPELTDEIVKITLDPESVTVVGNLPQPVAGACAVARPDGSVLLFGGDTYEDPDNDGTYRREPTDQIVSFDTNAGAVEVQPMTLPEPLTGVACAVTASGRILVMGGLGSDRVARDAIYSFGPFATTGTLLGPVVDSERDDVRWVSALWQADEPDGTSVTVSVRISATDAWTNDSDGWVTLDKPGMLPELLPRGRYIQWRAVLATEDHISTPKLTEVLVQFKSQ